MSAALKSYLPQPIPTRSRREKRFVSFRTSQLDQGSAALVVPEKVQSAPQESRPVPLVPPASGTTQLLSKLQLVSSVLTGALVGLALVSYGVSDEYGYNVVENPVSVHDFQATVLHLLGFSAVVGGAATHVGLYIGDGEFIHSSTTGVRVSDLRTPYWQQHFISARRMVGG